MLFVTRCLIRLVPRGSLFFFVSLYFALLSPPNTISRRRTQGFPQKSFGSFIITSSIMCIECSKVE